MKITKAVVLCRKFGTDVVILTTEYPCPFVEGALPTQPPLQITFDATADTGADYVRKHFDMEPEIILI